MVGINLVPERVRSAEKLKIIIAVGVVAQALPILFWLWRYGGVKAELSLVEDEIIKVNSELASPQLKNVVAEVEQFTQDRQNLESKRSVVDVLRKRQSTFVRLYDVLPDLVPRRSWLRKMETISDKGKTKIQVEGTAMAPEVVAEFYSALQSHPSIKDAEMTESPKVTTLPGGSEAVTFKLKFSAEDFE